MSAVKVHFDTGRRTAAACSAYLASTFATVPAEVTCTNCRNTTAWRKAAGIAAPLMPRPHRLRARSGSSRVDIKLTGTSDAVETMRGLLHQAGFEIVADLDGSHVPPRHRSDVPVGEVELLDLTPEDRPLDPVPLVVDRSVALGEVDPLPVHDQPHRDRVAHSLEEHQ
ncbi:hypothetical protein [Frankia sp. AgW1.1]|uniref:hypothetical protein n=1 Tax=Frankia sp. AgW1.1 TaxID=1836971 RepID=UPI001EE3DAD7|nr:hypothetical protein [Frankia sp. AgW1.1]MBL7487138.1 hypothetical protein [Frankia sp. AgW1.1]